VSVRLRNLWNKTTREVQFYLTSLESDARKLGHPSPLGIENGLHWTLDVTLKKMIAVFVLDIPQNLAILRRIALNTLNREQSFQRSTRQKNLIELQWI